MATKTAPPTAIMISKPGCHLCEDMWRNLNAAAAQEPCRIKVVNIYKGDDGYYERYWDKIPVLLIDNVETFMYRATIEDIIERLRSAAA